MIYDEGFDVNIDDFSFFAFSKYSPNPKKNPFLSKKDKWVSMCYSTLLGWYHKGDDWGCFFATKDNENPNKITNGEVNDKLLVVEGTVKKQTDNYDLMRFKENSKKLNKNILNFRLPKKHNDRNI